MSRYIFEKFLEDDREVFTISISKINDNKPTRLIIFYLQYVSDHFIHSFNKDTISRYSIFDNTD